MMHPPSDRVYWMAEDPINIAEGLYAIASITSIYRLSHLAVFSEKLGPLKISMSSMTVVNIHFETGFKIQPHLNQVDTLKNSWL